DLLYTRRIGRGPQIDLPSDVTYEPLATDILAAAKVTGRTESGWTVGLLDAFTDDARGTYIDATGATQSGIVEPRSNYFVGRLSRDLRQGDTMIGAMGTAVNRDLGDARAAAWLTKSAYTGAVDF